MKITLDFSKRRLNRTRYEAFWSGLNWKLPDGVLAAVWNVDRGNLRARRVRLAKGPPRWRLLHDHHDPVFKAAIALESLKAKKFTEPKPARSNPATKGENFPIAGEISLEAVRCRTNDGGTVFDLHLKLLNVHGKYLAADIDTDEAWTNPVIVSSSETLGLLPEDCRALAMAAFTRMLRFFGEGPTGGTIRWARWVEPDLTSWLFSNLYRQTAERVVRVLASNMPTDRSQLPSRSFSESVEV